MIHWVISETKETSKNFLFHNLEEGFRQESSIQEGNPSLRRWGISPRGVLSSMGFGNTPVGLKLISTLQ